MKIHLTGLSAIHCSVVLMGGASLFAKFLTLSPAIIVCIRTFVAAITLAVLLPLLKIPMRIQRIADVPFFLAMGGILAIHWVTFFYSIQISTVAVGLLSYSTFPVFVTFIEPLFFKERFQKRDIFSSLVVFFGLLLVVPNFDLGDNVTLGVFWGVISGLTFALITILNRKFVARYSALTLALYQDIVACLLLLPFTGAMLFSVSSKELSLLLLLGVVFTAGAHSLFIEGMTVVKAQLASIISCLEPIYAIIFALLLLNEVPSEREILGGIVIVGTVFFTTKKKQTATKGTDHKT